MTDKTDDPGKPRPGDRRLHATLDLTATEVGRSGGSHATAPGAQEGPAGGFPGVSPEAPRPDVASRALPPPPSAPSLADRLWRMAGTVLAMVAGWLAAATAWIVGKVRGSAHLSHAAAGVAGAALTLVVAGLLGLLAARQVLPPDAARRLAALEQGQGKSPTLPAGLAEKVAAVDKRLAGVEEQAKAIAALRSEQARLAAEAKALKASLAAPETAERLAKLEAALAALADSASTGAKSDGPGADKRAARLAELEKLAGEAQTKAEAKAAVARLEADLNALKAETTGLRHSLEALKAAVEEAMAAKLAGVERDLAAVKKTAGERIAGAKRVLLALEIANLKRALDRGGSYARELEAAKKAAGGAVDLAALDGASATGMPTLGALAKELKAVVSAALDAESERPGASVLDRLVSGARSVVRLRKTEHAADDASAEATLARIEAAVKDGNVAEALAQGRRLPPKAAAAAAGWLARLEARHAADKAIAEIEAGLKSALTGPDQVAPEPKR